MFLLKQRGKGHFVGINYYIHCQTPMWYGEGDDIGLLMVKNYLPYWYWYRISLIHHGVLKRSSHFHILELLVLMMITDFG